jgi:hypothetical protein
LRLRFIFSTLFLAAVITSVSFFSNVNAAAVDFEDEFETGNLTRWSGYRASNGETICASSYRSYLGAYGGRATTNGGGGVEYAYTYQRLSSSELYIRVLFYVAQSGLVEDGDRFYLMALQSGVTTLASIGWRVVDGQVKWFLAVNNGGQWSIAYSSGSPVVNKWYSVQVYWKQDAAAGESRLWIEQPYWWDQSPVCQLTGLNTASYGGISEIRCGLPTVSFCAKTAVYFDNLKTSSDYVQPIYDLGFGVTNYSDDFESGALTRWSEVKTQSGVAYPVSNNVQAGVYSCKFATVNYGQAYCTKNIALSDYYSEGSGSSLFQVGGNFYISALNINRVGGRVYLFRAWDAHTEIIAAGIEKTPDGLRWFMDKKDGTQTVTTYSANAPVLNNWVEIMAYWNPFEYVWGVTGCYLYLRYVDGSYTEELLTPSQNAIVYDTITRLDFGIAKSVNCQSACVYLDNVAAYSYNWE